MPEQDPNQEQRHYGRWVGGVAGVAVAAMVVSGVVHGAKHPEKDTAASSTGSNPGEQASGEPRTGADFSSSPSASPTEAPLETSSPSPSELFTPSDSPSETLPPAPLASASTSVAPKPTAKPTPRPTVKPKPPVHRPKVVKDTDPEDNQVDHVLIISMDGFAARLINAKRTPWLASVEKHGVFTGNARTDADSTVTLPNHTGMLTGRPMNGAAGTHVSFDQDNGKTLQDISGRPTQTIFSNVHDHDGSTALYSDESKFAFYNRSENAQNGAKDIVGKDNGRDKIDTYLYKKKSSALVTSVISDLKNGPATLTFLHLDYTDTAGHKYGFSSKKYEAAAKREDRAIGRIISVIRQSPELQKHMAIIITADHGGAGPSHSDYTHESSYDIPFIVSGPGVAIDKNIYSLNKKQRVYVTPGHRRPEFSTGAGPVRNTDAANVAADLLDLPAVAGSVADAKLNLHLQ